MSPAVNLRITPDRTQKGWYFPRTVNYRGNKYRLVYSARTLEIARTKKKRLLRTKDAVSAIIVGLKPIPKDVKHRYAIYIPQIYRK